MLFKNTFMQSIRMPTEKESVNTDGQPCHLYQQKNVLARLEPVSGFPSLYVVVFIVVSDFEERVGFVDIDGIVDHHV
jgi:hypothetical protein